MKTILSILALLGVVAGCGGAVDDMSGPVHITANDAMQFNKRAFQIRMGNPVSITLENIGKMPKETMGHNLVILKPGSDRNAFGIAAAQAKDTDYIPADQQDRVVAHTKLLGPGEKETIEFNPTQAGEYPYLCSFPGHFGTMKGTIVVRR
ncbi:MAG: azurin [Planctomycetota bacterium]